MVGRQECLLGEGEAGNGWRLNQHLGLEVPDFLIRAILVKYVKRGEGKWKENVR